MRILQIGLKGRHHDLGTERSRCHRDLDDNLEIVTIATEDLVRSHLEFDI